LLDEEAGIDEVVPDAPRPHRARAPHAGEDLGEAPVLAQALGIVLAAGVRVRREELEDQRRVARVQVIRGRYRLGMGRVFPDQRADPAQLLLPQDIRLGAIDPLTIKPARAELSKRYAAKTVTLTMSHLLAIMRAAFAAGRIGRDRTIGARSNRRRSGDEHRVKVRDVPTRAEVAAIWNAAPINYRAAIALGATGLRIGEVLGLTADRIDLELQLVTIDRQLQRIGNDMMWW
jgi:integrase